MQGIILFAHTIICVILFVITNMLAPMQACK